MEKKIIEIEKILLVENYEKKRVEIFINYLKSLLEKLKKNEYYIQKILEKDINFFINNFKIIYENELNIDGNLVSIDINGVVLNYQAYRKILLIKYPDTIIDIQLVRQDDEFHFEKNKEKINYIYKPHNIFEKKNIIGAYCYVKNARGEYIEIMNEQDFEKIKSIAKTKYVWNMWEDEMKLKTILKRACKRYYYDVVENIEKIDNQNYDINFMSSEKEETSIEKKTKKEIENIENIDNLRNLYFKKKQELDEKIFLNLKKNFLEKKENLNLKNDKYEVAL